MCRVWSLKSGFLLESTGNLSQLSLCSFLPWHFSSLSFRLLFLLLLFLYFHFSLFSIAPPPIPSSLHHSLPSHFSLTFFPPILPSSSYSLSLLPLPPPSSSSLSLLPLPPPSSSSLAPLPPAKTGSLSPTSSMRHGRRHRHHYSDAPRFVNRSHWYRYPDHHCCHPKNCFHACCHRPTYWNGYR